MVVLKFCYCNYEVLTLLIGREHNVGLAARWVARKIKDVIVYPETTYTIDNVLDMEGRCCTLNEQGIYELLLDAHMYHYSLIRFSLDETLTSEPQTFIFGDSDEDYLMSADVYQNPDLSTEASEMTDHELKQFLSLLESRQKTIMTAARLTQEQQERLLASCESTSDKCSWDVDLEKAFMPEMPGPDVQEEFFDPICCTSEATRVDHFVDALFDFAKKEESERAPASNLQNEFSESLNIRTENEGEKLNHFAITIEKEEDSSDMTDNSSFTPEQNFSHQVRMRHVDIYNDLPISYDENYFGQELKKHHTKPSLGCQTSKSVAEIELDKLRSWPDVPISTVARRLGQECFNALSCTTAGTLSMTTATSTDFEGRANKVPVETQTESEMTMELAKMCEAAARCSLYSQMKKALKATHVNKDKVIRKKKSSRSEADSCILMIPSEKKEKVSKVIAESSREQTSSTFKKSTKKDSKDRKDFKEKKEPKEKKDSKEKRKNYGPSEDKRRKSSGAAGSSGSVTKRVEQNTVANYVDNSVYDTYRRSQYYDRYPEEPVRPKPGEMLVLHSIDEIPIERMKELNIVRLDGKNFKKIKSQPTQIMRSLHRMPMRSTQVAPGPCLVFKEESDFRSMLGKGIIKTFRVKNIGMKNVHWPNIAIKYADNLLINDISILPDVIEVEQEFDIEIEVELKEPSLDGILVMHLIGDTILSPSTAIIVHKTHTSQPAISYNEKTSIEAFNMRCLGNHERKAVTWIPQDTQISDTLNEVINQLSDSKEQQVEESAVQNEDCSEEREALLAEEAEVESDNQASVDTTDYLDQLSDHSIRDESDVDSSEDEYELVDNDDELSNYEYNDYSEE